MSEIIRLSPDTYSVAEAAQVLGVSGRHIYRLIAQNECPFRVLKLGTSVRIPKSALEAYINEG